MGNTIFMPQNYNLIYLSFSYLEYLVMAIWKSFVLLDFVCVQFFIPLSNKLIIYFSEAKIENNVWHM